MCVDVSEEGIGLKYIAILIVFCFTVLFAYDYFPGFTHVIEVPKTVFIILVLGLFLISMLFKRDKRFYEKAVLKWQVFIASYILFLMGLFTVLGGKSTSRISFSNGVFWLVLLISIFEILSQWKKVKNSQSISS